MRMTAARGQGSSKVMSFSRWKFRCPAIHALAPRENYDILFSLREVMLIGAIIDDIVGSRVELDENDIKTITLKGKKPLDVVR